MLGRRNLRYSALNPNITELGLKSLADNFRDFYHHKDISPHVALSRESLSPFPKILLLHAVRCAE